MAARAADEGQHVAATVRGRAGDVGDQARVRSRQVARATAADARGLVNQVKDEASVVLQEASGQARRTVDETRTVLQTQAAGQLDRLSLRLRQLSDEATALADGDPEAAATLRDLVAEGATRLADVAERVATMGSDIETQGVGAALSDLQRFARRRPGLFLLGALGGGFVVGRIVRSSTDDDGYDEYGYEDVDEVDDGYGYRRPAAIGRGR